jgi:Holliday junction resolvase
MSKSQRDKGAGFERDIVNMLKAHGYEAGRNLSQTRDGGGDIDLPRWMLECKRYAKIAVYTWLKQAIKAAKPGQVPVVIARADKEEAIAILRLTDFMELMNAKEVKAKAYDPIVGISKASDYL